MSPHGVYRSTTEFTRERFSSVDLRKATKLVLHCFVHRVESNFRSELSVPPLHFQGQTNRALPHLGGTWARLWKYHKNSEKDTYVNDEQFSFSSLGSALLQFNLEQYS